VANCQPLAGGEREQSGDFVARIDQDGVSGPPARHDESILEERPHSLCLD
jgi:hypothetical protein